MRLMRPTMLFAPLRHMPEATISCRTVLRASGPNSLAEVSPNRNFTGRDELLVALRTAMTSGKSGGTIQAICGLGGVGKTQVATEYAYRHTADYTLVWWIRGDNDATVASDYAALAKPLQLQLSEGNESN